MASFGIQGGGHKPGGLNPPGAALCVAAAGATADGHTFWVLNIRQNIIKVVAVGAVAVVFYYYTGGRWRGHCGREAPLGWWPQVRTWCVVCPVFGRRSALRPRPAPECPQPTLG